MPWLFLLMQAVVILGSLPGAFFWLRAGGEAVTGE
jgi:hypothetical protein